MFDDVWLVPPKASGLVSPYDVHDGCKRIVGAQAFTVSLVTVVVTEDLDGWLRGRNDVFVLTKTSLGEQPFVERIHFYEEEVPEGKPIRHMLAENVLVCDDYSGTDRLWFELNILEVDTDTGERKAAVKAFQSLAATAGAVYPAIVPHVMVASGVVSAVEKLVSALERDTNVVKCPISLYPHEPRPGRAPFQTGSYVAFAQPVDPSGYKLGKNGLVTRGGKPSEVSYVVFDIAAVKTVSPKFVTTQKIATLLTQMKQGNPNSAQSTLDFLGNTLTAYSNYKQLRRYLELKAKDSPTAEEQDRMRELEGLDALKPFLPGD